MTDLIGAASPPPDAPRPHVLYITRTGMMEPLGQSQVLAYLRLLSSRYDITLVSFEKPEDRADQTGWKKIEADCAAHRISWRPQPFHYKPRIIAPAWSILVLIFVSLRVIARRRVAIIHARSYLPAAVALAIGKLFGIPFIFDMRALWPEELIAAGHLRRELILHRLIVRAERAALKHAAAVVSLTRAAVTHLRQIYPAEMAGQRVAVIPTCADIGRFLPAQTAPATPIYGCVGTVLSGWFRLDWLAAFFEAAALRHPDTRFEIVTRDSADRVRTALGQDKGFQSRLEIYPMPPERVHEAIQRHSVSVMFFTEGLSKLGSSPTRMAEVLGCGLPVVTNDGVGDTGTLVREAGVGVIVAGKSAEDMASALDALGRLTTDADLASRCRGTAERILLEAGAAAYAALYEGILSGAPARQPEPAQC